MTNHPNRNWRKKTQAMLASFRAERGLSMDEAAALFGMNHRSEWFYYESGKRKPDALFLRLVEHGGLPNAYDCPEEHSAYLREWRESRKLTQAQAAKLVGKPLQTWKKWESSPGSIRYTHPTRWLWPVLSLIETNHL